jgi:hypothetical protein
MIVIRRCLAAITLLVAFSVLPAAAEIAPRRLIVSVEAKGGDAYTATELLQLSRSLMTAIEASDTDILLVDWGPDPFPVDDPDAIGETVKRTADCWLVVTVGGGRRSPVLSLTSFDTLLKKQVISGKVQLDAAVDFPDPPAATWEAVVGLVRTAYPPLDTDQPVKLTAAERPALWTKDLAVLTLHAAPGTVIAGLDSGPQTMGGDGVLKESVRSPATYTLSATHPGQLPLQVTIYLEEDRDITLPQQALARWSLDAGLYAMSFSQVEGSYYLVPGWLYVRAGLMTYLAGLAFSSDRMFWSEPLTTLHARVGTYLFFPQESWFRTYLGAGAFLRVAHPLGLPPIYIDQAAPWGVQLTLGLEVSPWPRSRFFLEWLPTEYLTPYPDLFVGSLSWVPSSMVFLPFAALDLGGFRLGWRLMW